MSTKLPRTSDGKRDEPVSMRQVSNEVQGPHALHVSKQRCPWCKLRHHMLTELIHHTRDRHAGLTATSLSNLNSGV